VHSHREAIAVVRQPDNLATAIETGHILENNIWLLLLCIHLLPPVALRLEWERHSGRFHVLSDEMLTAFLRNVDAAAHQL
jgi:hypothetical protein